jgi:Rps23 Pro-64 3,4-dihydroxylase Tpa1-like proline 4-hydroxylase
MINNHNWNQIQRNFLNAKPFNYAVIDDFFTDDVAKQLVAEFPSYDSAVWNAHYHNALEDKKACNRWDNFPATTYKAFSYLTGEAFTFYLQQILSDPNLAADAGLHGGGWHAHTKGGKNNIHLDYSIHPKLELQRKLNIIIYISPEWDTAWGGGLEIWDHNEETGGPRQCVTTVENRFNRAVIFDTTQNSWHGLPKELNCPDGSIRCSLAAYYVTEPLTNADPRGKALFAPYGDQVNDPDVIELIKKRSNVTNAPGVYKS